MGENILKIQNELFKYKIDKENLYLNNSKEEFIIPLDDIYSIRKIHLFKIEFYLYIFLTIFAFKLWWVLGVVFTIYTYVQYQANIRVLLITSKGQMIFKFDDSDKKEIFLDKIKKYKPDAFSMKKWFKFGKRKK